MQIRLVARIVEDLDLARLDDEEFESSVADRNEGLTVLATSRQQRRALASLQSEHRREPERQWNE
jgi:hypothetical protein